LHPISRRELLGSLAALGAGTLAPARAAAKKGRIDVHHHITPPGAPAGGGSKWSPEIAIEEMDRNGVAAGIGYPGPVVGSSSDLQGGRKQAREWNEYGARIGTDHPGRFGLFAALPLADADGSLLEIEYALDVLKADGFGIATSYGEMWLGDAKLRPVFEELNRRQAVVFVHPVDAACCTPATLTYEKPPLSGAWIEWPMNTARTIFSLMASGTLRQLPDIRFIFCHDGGVMPLLISRIAGFAEWDAVGPEKLRSLFPDGIAAEFRKLYFEGAQGFAPENMEALMKVAPISHILFGTDYNRFPIAHSTRLFDSLKLAPAIRQAIGRDNALALLPRRKAL
jgi:predicted TIM-barrel fold metal-dependent hydrolase